MTLNRIGVRMFSTIVLILVFGLAEVGIAQGRGSRSRPADQAPTGRAVPRGEAGSAEAGARPAPSSAPAAQPERAAPQRPERAPRSAPSRLPSRPAPEARAVPRATPRSEPNSGRSWSAGPGYVAPDYRAGYAPRYGGRQSGQPRYYAPRYAPPYRSGSSYGYSSRYGAVRPLYRPYYSFRPRTRLSIGLYIGYPVAFPSWYSPYLPGAYTHYRPGMAYGGVSFDIYPPDAAIYIDGEYVGIADDFTSVRPPLTLPAGRHHIYIDAYGFAPLSFEITVVPRQVIPYQGSLSR